MVFSGFELIKEAEIPELKTSARLFRHVRTGAELLSLENADENKVFGISFRTPPPDSSGLPHIMEHAVLCGSRKYPVKEPFVELVKGSLNTFLNAFTAADKTIYPVASQNLQDFYNLVEVYVDAVFFPLLPPHVLDQEGWHYELNDLQEPLVYKGVVFNEMKGAYSSPDNLLGTLAQQSLFPDSPYGLDSGGDPRVIPQLTYAQFKAFHQTYYHPSNARIFFYGDDDPQERLRRMDSALAEFSARSVDSSINLQARFDASRQVRAAYDAGEDADGRKGMLVVNWLLDEPFDPELNLGLGMLAYILIGTPASPLRKALIDSGLGEDLAGAGLDADLRQMTFSTGLKGIADGSGEHAAEFDQVEALILQTLQDLTSQGIDPQTIAAAVNTTEFRLRENNTGSFPRGLLLMLRALNTWNYDGDPLAPLAFETPLAALKTRLAAGERYFENLIQTYLLDNLHRTTVILQPEPGYQERQEETERQKLEHVRSALSLQELQAIHANTQHLKEIQETPDTPQALSTIPNLKLEDLERSNKLIPLEILSLASLRTFYHDLFTNGIIYLDLGFDLHVLDEEHLPYIPLFGRALVDMGTETEDFVRLSQRIGSQTGGIWSTRFISPLVGSRGSAAWLFLRSKSTMDHAGDLLGILRDVLLTVRLDNQERFHQMVLEEKADMEAGLTPAGHRFVNTRLRSFYHEAGWLDEQMGGVSYLFFLRRLVEAVENDWPGVLAALEEVRRRLLLGEGGRPPIVNLTLDEVNWRIFQPQLHTFLASLPQGRPDRPHAAWAWNGAAHDLGLAIPTQVNYVGLGADLFKLGYQSSGSSMVISNFLRTTWLWEKVRVQGGAYGAFSVFDHRSGVLTLLSYRDPNLLETLEIFNQAGGFLRQLDSRRLDQAELTKSIIGAIGDLDAYQLPDAKGFTSLARSLAGETDEARQMRREQVLATSLADFHAFGEVLERLPQDGQVVVMGAEDDLRSANAACGDRLQVIKVL